MKTKNLKFIPSMGIGTIALLSSIFLCPINHYITALVLITCSIVVYFYCVFVQSHKNWWDIRAVFSAVWLLTNGFAALRLMEYQVAWEAKTWICQAIAYLGFHLGTCFGDVIGERLYQAIKQPHKPHKRTIAFKLHPERLFWICFIVTFASLLSFFMNVKSKGFIPYFVAAGNNDYLNFYTKWYVFAVAGTMISGLNYYVLKTQKLVCWKRIFLWGSIVYSTFLFPIFAVNRSALLTAGLSLTTAIFYLNKKRLRVLVLCGLVLIIAFAVCTNARGYSEAQLNTLFPPITIGGESASTIPTSDSPTSEPSATGIPVADPPVTGDRGFRLSGKASFIYSYLTVSHDNLNEAVRNEITLSYGIRQLAPFNVIFRIPALKNALDSCSVLKVREYLTTVSIIGDAYYDFGVVGVGIFMFLWATIFGAIQRFYLNRQGVFAMLALGNVMTPVALCFFSVWMSLFSFWMHWGSVLLMYIAACLEVKKQKDEILS